MDQCESWAPWNPSPPWPSLSGPLQPHIPAPTSFWEKPSEAQAAGTAVGARGIEAVSSRATHAPWRHIHPGLQETEPRVPTCVRWGAVGRQTLQIPNPTLPMDMPRPATSARLWPAHSTHPPLLLCLDLWPPLTMALKPSPTQPGWQLQLKLPGVLRPRRA